MLFFGNKKKAHSKEVPNSTSATTLQHYTKSEHATYLKYAECTT